MNCPDCDTLMFRDECGCGFKIPRASTIEIKKVGAQESTAPKVIDENAARALNATTLTGKPFGEWCFKYCMDVLKKANARNELEKLKRKGMKNART